jgi:hypothetical protein
MAVEVKDTRKVVVIGWDTDIVKGENASIQTSGEGELRNVKNDGESNLFFPMEFAGPVDVIVRGSSDGEDTGTIYVR